MADPSPRSSRPSPSSPPSSPPSRARAHRLLPLLIATMGAVLAAQTIARDPRYLAPFAAFAVLMFAPAMLSRWRMRKLLVSADVDRVIETWQAAIPAAAPRATLIPLLQATAYAAYGRIEAARRALERALPGPAWDAALEQRLFIETLLDAFEGDRDGAVRKSAALAALPVPLSGFFARRRIALLRGGLGALARAFAHSSRRGDAQILERAGSASPLVHWAMRYAAAIIAVDSGHTRDVAGLLANAPPWPAHSAFSEYHTELLARST